MAANFGPEIFDIAGEKRHYSNNDKKEGFGEVEPAVHQNGVGEAPCTKRFQYHSEYQKKFRDFNQYDYVDGKFISQDRSVTPTSTSWYGEVIELRKKAEEYKLRGWGTEFIPQHLVEAYHKQMALLEHVSRRSTLSALTLASAMHKPKAVNNDDKCKNSARKYRQHRSLDRAPSASYRKTERLTEPKRPPIAKSKKNINGANSAPTHPVTANGSPEKSESRTGSSSSANKPVRPTSLITSNGPPRSRRDISISATRREPLRTRSHSTASKANNSNSVHSPRKKMDELDSHARTSDLINALVISPPEPTRVKSPEEMMTKSPDPVNWTVPLDTGKPFTVTQNIRDDDIHNYRAVNESKQSNRGFSYLNDNTSYNKHL